MEKKLSEKFETFEYEFYGESYEYIVSHEDCLHAYLYETLCCNVFSGNRPSLVYPIIREIEKQADERGLCIDTFIERNREDIKDCLEEEAKDAFDESFFVCKDCGLLCDASDKCPHDNGNICTSCCDECRSDSAYWDNYNREVDEYILDR